MAAVLAPSIYLDANVLIYAVEAGSPWTGQLYRLFSRINAGEVAAKTSELALAEVLPKPLSLGSEALVETYEVLLSSATALQAVAIDRPILRTTARLRGALRLKLADAIHVATALESGCTHFVTNDTQILGSLPQPLVGVPMHDIDQL